MIHPTAIIDEEHGPVVIGGCTHVGPYSVIRGPVTIGSGCQIHSHVVIGEPGESATHYSMDSPIIIENDVTLRERVTVQRGLGPGYDNHGKRRHTLIESGAYIMHGCHIAHDVLVAANAVLAPRVVLGGHSNVLEGAYMGIGSMTHQFVTVGALAMVGMGAVANYDVMQLDKVVGVPARKIGMNSVGRERSGADHKQLQEWLERYRLLAMRPAKGDNR